MKCLYRISEGVNRKRKLDFVHDKKRMFLHFLSIFREHDIYVFADNVGDELYSYLISQYDKNKIIRTQHLGNDNSFLYIVDFAMNQFRDEDIIYFAEDDYIYKKGADKIIQEGL
jgi:hypothetical protein